MRNHLILLTLFFAQLALGQDKRNLLEEYPFQVVYAENAELDNGLTTVSKYDYIKKDSQIRLDSGFLILMHHSEKLFEFSGDTLVSIESVLLGMSQYLKESSIDRPDIYYFSKYRPKKFTNYISCCNPDYFSFYGFNVCPQPIQIGTNQSILLHWESGDQRDGGEYLLIIRNIYDDILQREKLVEPFFLLDPGKFGIQDKRLLIVQVEDVDDSDKSSGLLGIQLEGYTHFFPDWRQNRSIDNLQAWYFLTIRGDYRLAREYLARLNIRSTHSFYRNLAVTWADQ